MATTDDASFATLDLEDDRYTVEQSLIRNKYEAEDSSGRVVLRGKQKLFKMKEEFPFVNGEGEDAFTVKASGILDVAGNYVLIDAATEEPLVILDNDFSIFQDTWRIRDAESEQKIAEINSRGAMITLARSFIPLVGPLIPHEYEITDAEGGHVGKIEGELAVKDRYQITIDDASSVPKETIVAAAMVIDAIQGN